MSQNASSNQSLHFEERLLKELKYVPTAGQKHLANAVTRFLFSEKDKLTFVLKGFAGTGKTTFIGALVKVLPSINLKTVMLAPTGRAAKVMQSYSGREASTIHRKIYEAVTVPGGGVHFELAKNKHKNTIFLVDEASMIAADGALSGGNDLLDDLANYVFEGVNCRLILVGDTAQLPPVGSELSPALDIQYLRRALGLTAGHVELTEVVRQAEGSGILNNATKLREALLAKEFIMPKFDLSLPDVQRIGGYELQDELEDAYGQNGMERTIFICRSNKSANMFGQQVRSRILFHEEELCAGELLMVVKNNYTWLKEDGKPGLIANGDMMRVNKLLGSEHKYGFHFKDAEVTLGDGERTFEAKLMLDSIMAEGPSVPHARMKELYAGLELKYQDIKNRGERKRKILEDPYYNALQVKMAYAVTCHKAQGGQWPVVFIDQGYLTDEMMDAEYLRWLYTAFTRATQKVYLVNFGAAFFEED